MSRKKRFALIVVLASYMAIGLVAISYFRSSAPESMANEDLIRMFFDSLVVDSVREREYAHYNHSKYDSLWAVWQQEKLAREMLRKQHYDSAVHYWDSVKSVRASERMVRDSLYRSLKTTPERPIDIATANEDSLRRVPGIGEALASQIIAYRERLGGFVDVKQVMEVEHVSEEALVFLVLHKAEVRCLNVNRCSPAALRRHPYINGAQALAIYEARRKYGRIEGWHELLRLAEFTAKDKERLEPYIDFSVPPSQ